MTNGLLDSEPIRRLHARVLACETALASLQAGQRRGVRYRNLVMAFVLVTGISVARGEFPSTGDVALRLWVALLTFETLDLFSDWLRRRFARWGWFV